jgi:hypothetical protein
MPLPKERLSQDAERHLDAGMAEETIATRMNSCVGYSWNWDKETRALQEIFDNPACEASAALLSAGRSAPEFYLQYADRDTPGADTLEASTSRQT